MKVKELIKRLESLGAPDADLSFLIEDYDRQPERVKNCSIIIITIERDSDDRKDVRVEICPY